MLFCLCATRRLHLVHHLASFILAMAYLEKIQRTPFAFHAIDVYERVLLSYFRTACALHWIVFVKSSYTWSTTRGLCSYLDLGYVLRLDRFFLHLITSTDFYLRLLTLMSHRMAPTAMLCATMSMRKLARRAMIPSTVTDGPRR